MPPRGANSVNSANSVNNAPENAANSSNTTPARLTIQQADFVYVHPESRKCPPALLSQLINNTTKTRLLIQQLKKQLDAALKRDEMLTNVLRGYHIEL